MIRLIRFILFLLYNYYKENRNTRIPYFTAITTFVLVLITNCFTLLRILRIDIDGIVPWRINDEYGILFVKVSLFLIPILLIIMIVFKKDKIVKLKYNNNQIERGKWLLLSYILLSFIAFILTASLVKA